MCGCDLVVLGLHQHGVIHLHRILLRESNYWILSTASTYTGKPQLTALLSLCSMLPIPFLAVHSDQFLNAIAQTNSCDSCVLGSLIYSRTLFPAPILSEHLRHYFLVLYAGITPAQLSCGSQGSKVRSSCYDKYFFAMGTPSAKSL